MMKRIASYILAFVVSLLMWGWLFQCHAQAPGARVGVLRKSTFTPTVLTASNYYHTTISVSDGSINAFVYQPYNIENPPTGGWPLVLDFGGDGTDSNATTAVTDAAMSTGDNLTYTISPTITGRYLLSKSVIIEVNGDSVGFGQLGGTITGTGITSGSFSVTSSTPTISVTFSSSQSGNTITANYLHSATLIEGIPLAINRGDTLDGRAIFIALQNFENNQNYNQDYFDKAVEWAYNNYTINIKRISCTGISRGGVTVLDQCQEGANTSLLKTRYQFWVDDTTGEVFTSSGVGRTETGLASIALCAPSYGGTFTHTNYSRVGKAIVHGTNDAVVTNSTVGFSNIADNIIEPPQVLNLWNVGHSATAWNTNYAYRLYNNVVSLRNAPWDWVDMVLKYSYDSVETATLHVEQAEKRRLGTEEDIIDYRKALRWVNLLPASSEKTALLTRLSALLPDIEGTGGTRWVLNHHNFGNDEASPYNNRQAHTVGVTPSNMITWPSAGASGLDFEVITNTTNALGSVGDRTYFVGGLSRITNKSGVTINSGTQVFGFNDVPSGTYTVRFYHNAQMSTNASGQGGLSVTLNSETKSQYSGINTLLGYIQFTGVPHTALDSFTVTRVATTDTFLMTTELYLHP